MTKRPLLVLSRLFILVVLVTSATYLFVYLYRWEWNRAILAGIFFVAAEVAMALSVLVGRLRALEDRLDACAPAASVETGAPRSMAAARLARTPVDRPDPFDWLSPRHGRTGVFVPVLLGAGVVLSALAYLVERLAQLTVLPGVDQRLARRLDRLAPPPGGLTGTAAPPPPARRGGSRLGWAAGLAVVALLVAVAIDAIGDATQSRPDLGPPPARTTIELVIAQRGTAGAAELAAEGLWTSCRSTLGTSRPWSAEVVPVEADRVHLVVTPGLGELSERRLLGCLTDLQLDLVQASLVLP